MSKMNIIIIVLIQFYILIDHNINNHNSKHEYIMLCNGYQVINIVNDNNI